MTCEFCSKTYRFSAHDLNLVEGDSGAKTH
jgi:hypothetical protein